jgi:hypothetical protein
MVSKFCGEVDHLKNENACLKNQLKDMQDAIRADKVGCQSQSSQVFAYSDIAERSVPTQFVSSYRDIVLRNQNTLQACAISNARNVHVFNSAAQVAVVSNDDAASEVHESRSSEAAVGDYVLVARKVMSGRQPCQSTPSTMKSRGF